MKKIELRNFGTRSVCFFVSLRSGATENMDSIKGDTNADVKGNHIVPQNKFIINIFIREGPGGDGACRDSEDLVH